MIERKKKMVPFRCKSSKITFLKNERKSKSISLFSYTLIKFSEILPKPTKAAS